MTNRPPRSRLTFFLLVFACLVILLLLESAGAVKSEYRSPAARHFRRTLEAQRKGRTVRRTDPYNHHIAPVQSDFRKPAVQRRKLENSFGSNDHVRELKHRQNQDISCNNVTITPPGFDGSCSIAEPCPNGACWCVSCCTTICDHSRFDYLTGSVANQGSAVTVSHMILHASLVLSCRCRQYILWRRLHESL